MDDGGKLTGVRGSGHPNRNRTHENDLQAITNLLGYRNGDGGRVRVAFHGGVIVGGLEACRYNILERRSTQWRHGEVKKLTTNQLEWSAASGKVSEGRVVDGGCWRERKGCG